METLQEQFRNAIIERMRQCIELGLYKMGACRLQLKKPPEQCPILKYKTYAKMLNLVCYCESFDVEEILDKLPPFKKCPPECTECRLLVEVDHVVQFCRRPVIQDTIIQYAAPNYFSCVKGTANESIFTSIDDRHNFNAVFYYGIDLSKLNYFLVEANNYNFCSFYLRIMKNTWVEKKEYENINRNELENIINSEIRGKESLFLIIALPKNKYLPESKESYSSCNKPEEIAVDNNNKENVGKAKYSTGNNNHSSNKKRRGCGCGGFIILFLIALIIAIYSVYTEDETDSNSEKKPSKQNIQVEEPVKPEDPKTEIELPEEIEIESLPVTIDAPTVEIETGSYRTWTDKISGKTIKGEFIKYDVTGKTHVRRSDGKIVKIPLKNLSDNDKEYVRERK